MKSTSKPKGMQLDVVITEEMIEHAVKRDSTHCMIADAIKGAFPEATHVSVDLATIRFTDPKKRLRYTFLTPRIAQQQLVRFDQGLEFPPFSFRLRQAHVTRSGLGHARRVASKAQKTSAIENLKSANDVLAKTTFRKSSSGSKGYNAAVPERVGGQTPPMQKTKDGVPFSRRRAFGLRALEF